MNVHTRELLDGVDVAVKHGRVAMFGDAAHTLGPETETIDAEGAYLVPGLIDTHLHVESAMVTVTRFAEAVLPHGTTTVFIDNHEIANVFGLEGIRWMVDEGAALPLKVFLAVPSCVPALPGFEDAGAVVGPDELREALRWPEVAGLGEMMNMPGVIGSDETVHELIAATLDAGQPVTGHWSLAGWDDHRLHAYAAAGIDSDHESVRKEDALAKLRAGMWVQFREGSAWHDVATLVPLLTEDGVDSRHVLLVTDDVHPETLVTAGHMNHVVRTAIEAGLDPLVAIQLATVNPGRVLRPPARPRVDRARAVTRTSSSSRTCASSGRTASSRRRAGAGAAPGVRLSRPRARLDPHQARARRRPTCAWRPPAPSARVRAIGMVPSQLATEHRIVEAPVVDGEVRASTELDLAKAASIERHGGPGTIGLGFVQGLGLERGAVATTVAHDNHNVLVVGMSDEEMLLAVERLRAAGGGMIAVAGREVLALVELPIAGLVSDRPVEEVAEQVRELGRAYEELGSTLEYPFMFVSLLSLGVIPALRLTNRGLVDGVEFELVPVLA